MQGKKDWKKSLAVAIGALAGFFWLAVGLAKFLSVPEAYDDLIRGMMIGGVVMISTVVADKNRIGGGILLILEALATIGMTFYGQGPLIAVALGVPLFVEGLMFTLGKDVTY